LKKNVGIVSAVCAAVMFGTALCVHAADAPRSENNSAPANFVAVNERIHTSGQPTQAQLATLQSKGYGFIINLATPASAGAIPEEGSLIARTGISYLNIPVDFKNPTYDDFELFSNILKQAGSRRVLVHCQVNKRASVFAFLYRVVHERVAPDDAWKNVDSVWEPEPQWNSFIRLVLKRHNIAFDPF
jgi:protein tyrosine phosphatase (PTP) superfamily phosphohydrolase (DUF442 family)